jgi:hypothetical protein
MSSCAKPSHFATCAPAPGRVTLPCSQWPRSRVGPPRTRPFPAARRIRQRITDTQTFRFFASVTSLLYQRAVDNDCAPAHPAVSHAEWPHAPRMCLRNLLSAGCSQVRGEYLGGHSCSWAKIFEACRNRRGILKLGNLKVKFCNTAPERKPGLAALRGL